MEEHFRVLLEAHIQVVAEGTVAAVAERKHCTAVDLVEIGLPWGQQNKCPLGNTQARCKQAEDSVGLQVSHKQRWRVLVDWNRYSGVDDQFEAVALGIDWAGENLFEEVQVAN
jgi:hypothetical protein